VHLDRPPGDGHGRWERRCGGDDRCLRRTCAHDALDDRRKRDDLAQAGRDEQQREQHAPD
jgi:hypothetical protein